MIRSVKLRILRWLHDHRRNRFVRRLQSVARTIHRALEHPGYDPVTNGEFGVLRTLSHAHLRVALDVGGNHGDWTALFLSVHPAAHVHLFEIAPPTLARARVALGAESRVTLYPFGLGGASQTVEVTYYPNQDHLTHRRLGLPFHSFPAQQIKAMIQRGDNWCASIGLNGIDFLKVDVEGMDLDVLRGFGRWVRDGLIRFIQFEHHGGRIPLGDYHALLEPAGYRVGKIYSRYVEFRDYSPQLEEAVGPNYLAVHSSEQTWLKRLADGF